jgi:hypothetical protein
LLETFDQSESARPSSAVLNSRRSKLWYADRVPVEEVAHELGDFIDAFVEHEMGSDRAIVAGS